MGTDRLTCEEQIAVCMHARILLQMNFTCILLKGITSFMWILHTVVEVFMYAEHVNVVITEIIAISFLQQTFSSI
jgi:hypothetical protein